MNVPSPCAEQRFITRKRAAFMLECSDQTISKLHKAGRLPFYYLGRNAVRIRLADLEAMLSESNSGRVQ